MYHSDYNREKTGKKTFRLAGSDEGQLMSPMGIAFTNDNHLLVVDKGNHRVLMFTLEGDLEFIKSVGQLGKGQLQFSSPQGIAVHPSSHQVFIADTGNHRIQVLNNNLTYSHEFGYNGRENGQFDTPVDVACDSHGNVYVADSLNKCVQVLSSSGQFIDTLSTDTSLSPTGIAIDFMNTVYVNDGHADTVLVFNSKRQFIKHFKTTEHMQNDQVMSPSWNLTGLAVEYTGNLLKALDKCEALDKCGVIVIY